MSEPAAQHPELYESTLQDVRWHLATLADEPFKFIWALDALERVEYVLGIPREQSAFVLRRQPKLGTES